VANNIHTFENWYREYALRVEFEECADYVSVARPRASVILSQIEELGGNAGGELFDDPGGGAVASPGVLQRVVPNFVGQEDAKFEGADAGRVVDLQPVAVHREIVAAVAQSPFDQVAIGKGEFAEREFKCCVEDQAMLDVLARRGRLLRDVEPGRYDRKEPVGLKRDARASALIHGPGQIAPHSEHAEKHQVGAVAYRENDLSLVPELRVLALVVNDGLRVQRREAAKDQEENRDEFQTHFTWIMERGALKVVVLWMEYVLRADWSP
jgi:hypothetical protein